jgi:hypothetical protein
MYVKYIHKNDIFYFIKNTYSSSQKYSNKHILNHNFFSIESFGFTFSGNLYVYLDQILAKN